MIKVRYKKLTGRKCSAIACKFEEHLNSKTWFFDDNDKVINAMKLEKYRLYFTCDQLVELEILFNPP
ncbi:hypothetical protein [Pedobacter sp.]|uniref:hypothetical protein n=1 Tax=Pedobacter sp. TaxID=1411316 RepID=UPI003D7FE619